MSTATAPSTALTVIERIEQSPAVLQLDARASALIELLPDEAAALRFRRVVIQALVKSPELLQCAPDSIVSAVFEAAAMGLEPTGAAGGAHLVSYNTNVGTKDSPRWEKRAQLIPDYRGIIRLVTKPPSDIVSMEARAVKEGDEFTYQLGSDAFVNHVPSLAPDRSTKATTHVYSIARLRAGGPPLVDVEDRAGIERVQKRGKERGFSPWTSDWDEMAKKTIIKRHAKVLPVRPEIRSILVREDDVAGDEPAPAAAPVQGATRTSRLATRLRAHSETAPVEPAFEGEAHEVEQPVALTQEQLMAGLAEAGIARDYAVEVSKTMFPRDAGVPLTDEQRAQLLVELVKESEPATAL